MYASGYPHPPGGGGGGPGAGGASPAPLMSGGGAPPATLAVAGAGGRRPLNNTNGCARLINRFSPPHGHHLPNGAEGAAAGAAADKNVNSERERLNVSGGEAARYAGDDEEDEDERGEFDERNYK